MWVKEGGGVLRKLHMYGGITCLSLQNYTVVWLFLFNSFVASSLYHVCLLFHLYIMCVFYNQNE